MLDNARPTNKEQEVRRVPRFPLEAGLCRIRPWRHSDKAALVKHADNRRIWLNLRDVFPHPYTAKDADAWLAHVAEQVPVTSFAIEAVGEGRGRGEEEAVGGIGLQLGGDVFRLSAEIGYWLGEAAWGKGIATAAVRAFTPWALQTFGLERIWAGVFSTNPASMRVLEKAGYAREAVLRCAVVKDGTLLDQVIYATVRLSDRSRVG